MKRFLLIILCFWSSPFTPGFLVLGSAGLPSRIREGWETSITATIGVILPLTGKYAAYGNRVLDAILMAASVWDRTNQSVSPCRSAIPRAVPRLFEAWFKNLRIARRFS
jgi:hypothetical protein